MSEPTLKELMENPTDWTEYSCECIFHMATEEIERLNEKSDIWEEECRKYAKQVERLREALNTIAQATIDKPNVVAEDFIAIAGQALEGER